jgi:hypothetical protein
LHQTEKNDIRLIKWQRGIDPAQECLHRHATRGRPNAIDVAVVAAHALELAL